MLTLAIPKAAAAVTAVVAAQTLVQRWAALPTFRAHRLLRELRPIGGNSTVAMQHFAQLNPTTATDESDYPVCLWKSSGLINQKSKSVVNDNTRVLMRKKLIVKSNRNSNDVQFAVYGRKLDNDVSPSQRIEQFLQSKIPHRVKVDIMADPLAFVQWMSAMNAVTVSEQKSRTNYALQPGTYRYCFRDYWNYEEEWAYHRWGIWQKFLVQPKARSQLEVESNDVTGTPTIRLVERSRLLCSLIPLRLMWTGTLRNGTILDWDYSEMRLGFKWWCKVIPRPGPSEKLRKAPWKLCGGTDDWFVVERQDYGRLNFARESALSE